MKPEALMCPDFCVNGVRTVTLNSRNSQSLTEMFPAHDWDVRRIDEMVRANVCQPKHFFRLHVAQVIASAGVTNFVYVYTDTSFNILEIDTGREFLEGFEEYSAGLFDDT